MARIRYFSLCIFLSGSSSGIHAGTSFHCPPWHLRMSPYTANTSGECWMGMDGVGCGWDAGWSLIECFQKDLDVCGMALHYTKTPWLSPTCTARTTSIPKFDKFGPVFWLEYSQRDVALGACPYWWTKLGNALHWTTVKRTLNDADCHALVRSDILLVQRYGDCAATIFFESALSWLYHHVL